MIIFDTFEELDALVEKELRITSTVWKSIPTSIGPHPYPNLQLVLIPDRLGVFFRVIDSNDLRKGYQMELHIDNRTVGRVTFAITDEIMEKWRLKIQDIILEYIISHDHT